MRTLSVSLAALTLAIAAPAAAETVAIVNARILTAGPAGEIANGAVVLRDGRIAAEGNPRDIVTPQLVEDVFGLPCVVIEDPISHTPLVIPKSGGIHPFEEKEL